MIEKLDTSVIKRIAAGEVINSPRNAVKELIENSLDAGATNISIALIKGGLDSIKIADNGHGIKVEDMPLLCERYTTSKLKEYKDLLKLNTFGFRGEALASIAQISTVTVVSKHKECDLGYQAIYQNGVLKSTPKVHASNYGCIITAENLFNNIPLRKKVLKSSAEEYHRILDCVKKYAVHNSHVSFTIRKESNVDMVCLKASNTLERVGQIYGRSTSLSLKSVQFENSKCKFRVFFNNVDKIFTGDKKDAFEFILFVNSRLVENAKLKKEVKDIYKSIEDNCKPYFVYITINVDPSHVDINVHPTKNEVHLLDEEEVIKKITDTLKDSLKSSLTNGRRKQRSPATPLLEKETLNYYFKTVSRNRRNSASSSSSNVSSVTTPPPASPDLIHNSNLKEVRRDNNLMEDAGFTMARQTEDEGIIQNYDSDPIDNGYLQSKKSAVSVGNKKRKSIHLDKLGYKQIASTATRQSVKNTSSDQEDPRDLDSIVKIKQEIKACEDKRISKIISGHQKIGIVDDVLYALTYKNRQYLINYNVVSEEHFYQMIINAIGKFGVIMLSTPVSIQDLLAISMPKATYANLKQHTDEIFSHKELLNSYYSLGLTLSDDQEIVYLVSLPMIVSDYAPNLDRLPILFHNLAKHIDWDNEMDCLDSLAHELSSLYYCCDQQQWEQALPLFQNGDFIAPRYLCDRGYVVDLDFPETVVKK